MNVKKKYEVNFSYSPLTAGRHEVSLIGDFNSWNNSENIMKESKGKYFTSIKLPPGKYYYCFLVDKIRVIDESAKSIERFTDNSMMSVLEITPENLDDNLHEVNFIYPSDNPNDEVFLVGDFNNWNPDRLRMHFEDGKFRKKILLYSKTYQYKFVVNGHWIIDPLNNSYKKNSFNENNSVINVDDKFEIVELKRGDGEINSAGLSTNILNEQINRISETSVEFKLNLYKENVEEVFFVMDEKELSMQLFAQDELFDHYRIVLDLKEKKKKFYFGFLLKDKETKLYILKNQFSDRIDLKKLFWFNIEDYEVFKTPNWVKNGIMYQIFCDRFFNGKEEINPDFKEWYYQKENIFSLPAKKGLYNFQKWEKIDILKDFEGHFTFYGGDIYGVQKKLDYLLDLGVTILYFNPLNMAESNHKYDTADYYKIDPHFATNSDFKKFVKICHQKGIKIIVDFAFNHTGVAFFAFQDAIKNYKNSEYYNWYEFQKKLPKDIPAEFNALDYYQCWWGHANMPDLNWDLDLPHPIENSIREIKKSNPNWNLVNYILRVINYWLTVFDIDGFRLDIPNEVPYWFWKLFRKEVKSIKPDAYIVGELWHNAEEWVNNRYFDAVMNYKFFKEPIEEFFIYDKISAKEFDSLIQKSFILYPKQALQSMMNLIDGHDTFRIMETLEGDFEKLKLIIIFQMTFIGCPHIWYGDEIGMKGGHDPDNRRPFEWNYHKNSSKKEIRDFYKKIIGIRKKYSSLRIGRYEMFYAKKNTLAYWRIYKEEKILVIFNNSKEEVHLKIPKGEYRSLLNYENENSTNEIISVKSMKAKVLLVK